MWSRELLTAQRVYDVACPVCHQQAGRACAFTETGHTWYRLGPDGSPCHQERDVTYRQEHP